jgi:hypothetical protein
MAKKMFDILPPKEARKLENTIKELGSSRKGKKPAQSKSKAIATPVVATTTPKKKHATKAKFPLWRVVAGVLVVVLLLVIYAVTKLPRAQIQIWPKTDTLTLSQTLSADSSLTASSATNAVIPARIIEETKSDTQQFPATGSASNDGKATGTIKVYNKTGSAFTLITGTHFLSDSGKYFVTLSKVNIPAGSNSSPGSVSVQVQAEQAGEDYNIKPSKFSAPKLYGTAYYYNIYGESTTAMTGGHIGQANQVTDDDINQAKDSLTKKLLGDATNTIKGKLGPDDVLLNDAIQNTVVDASANVKSGTLASNFNETANVKVRALVFKKQDVEKFVNDAILGQVSAGDGIKSDTLHIDYHVNNVDMQKGKVSMTVRSSVTTYAKITTDNVIDLLQKKSADQIKQIADQMYSGKISELKVSFWPFWVHTAPSNTKRINIQILFK